MNTQFGICLSSFFFLAACVSETSGTQTRTTPVKTDSRYTTLLEMDVPEFYGTLSVASLASQKCMDYRRDPAIDFEVNERRNERGNGSFSALTKRKAVRAAQEQMRQQFEMKHGTNICSAVARDMQNATAAYTYFLVPSA